MWSYTSTPPCRYIVVLNYLAQGQFYLIGDMLFCSLRNQQRNVSFAEGGSQI
jgi:hypothetical protein